MNDEIIDLALLAFEALIAQKPVSLTRHEKAPRNGLPIPIKRMKPDADGFVTQDYRPLAILEHVDEVLSGREAAKRLKAQAKARKAAKKEPK